MNSVVLGTRAKRVIPRNFSSMPDPFKITSTTSTRSSRGEHQVSLHVKCFHEMLHTSNERIKESTTKQDTCASEPTPRRCVMASIGSVVLRMNTSAPLTMHLLVSKRTNRCDCNGSCKVVCGHWLGQFDTAQVSIFDNMINAFHNWKKIWRDRI